MSLKVGWASEFQDSLDYSVKLCLKIAKIYENYIVILNVKNVKQKENYLDGKILIYFH